MPSRPLRPFLFGISFRIASAYERKRRREVAFGVVEVGDAGPGPDDALQSKQARALVLAALERIPLPRRAVLVMHDIDDVPVSQVASIARHTALHRLLAAAQGASGARGRDTTNVEGGRRPMSRERPPLSPEVRALLDHEREIPPLPASVRARALARARAALVAGVSRARRRPRRRRGRGGRPPPR